MKRLSLLALALWVALADVGNAAILHRNCNVDDTNGASSVSVNAPTNANGDAMEFCLFANGALTFPPGTTALTGTGLPISGSGFTANCATKTASSEPGSYTFSWGTGNFGWASVCAIEGTDGTTPAVDIAAGTFSNSASSITPASVTTTQAGDMIDNIGAGGFFFSAASAPTSQILLENVVSEQSGAIQTFGQPAAGATLQSAMGQAGTGGISAITIAWKNTTPTSAMFVGAGAPTDPGTGTSINPAIPTNYHSGDTLLTLIHTGTPGTNPIPPVDVVLRPGTGANACGTGNQTLTISAGAVSVGDKMTFQIASANTLTVPTNNGGWSCPVSTTTVDKFTTCFHTANSTDAAGISYAWNVAGNTGFVNWTYADFYSLTGSTITVDVSNIAEQSSNTTSFAAPVITTTGANEPILINIQRSVTGEVTLPAPLAYVAGTDHTSACGFGTAYYAQGAAGASATPSLTAASGQWILTQIALKGGASLWQHVASTPLVDATNVKQLDAYIYPNIPGSGLSSTYTYTFPSSVTTPEAVTIDLANLNTTTPFDTYNTLINAGTYQTVLAALPKPTANDDLALEVTDGASGAVINSDIPSPLVRGNNLAIYYSDLMYAAASSQPVGNNQNTSTIDVTFGMNSASTPSYTTANGRVNQLVREIFSTSAPSPVAGASLFELEVP